MTILALKMIFVPKMLTLTHLHVCAVHVDPSSNNYKINLYVHVSETGMTTEAQLMTHLATPAILQDDKLANRKLRADDTPQNIQNNQ